MKLFHTGKRIGKQGQIVGLVGVSIMAASAAGIVAGVLMEDKKYRKDVFIASGSGVGASLIIVIASFNRMHKADRYIIKAVERYNNVIKDRWGISIRYNNKNSQFGLALNYKLQ